MTESVQSLADGYIRWVRSHVGHELIYLVYASVVIFDEVGRVLAQERYDFDWWSVPGGAMELREALPETARREVREECGIDVALHGLVGVYSHPRFNLHYPNGDDVQQWTVCFWGEIAGGTLRPDGAESLRLFFAEPEAILVRTHPAHAAMIQDALRVRAGQPPALEPVESFPPLKPYYPILRRHVGQQPIILPGATAIIEDDQGRILMIHRTDEDCWTPPGGLSDLGETTTATLVREVREETGLEVEPYAIVGLYSDPALFYGAFPNGDQVHAVDLTMACRVIGGTLAAQGNDDESREVAFLPPEAAAERGCMAWVGVVIRDYFDRNGWPHVR